MDEGAVTELTTIVALAKTTPGAELEIRIGCVHKGKFSVGCSAEAFHRIHNKLCANKTIERTPWVHTQSFTYPSNIRVVHGSHTAPIVMNKRCIAHRVIPSGNGVAFKLSLASELERGDATLPRTNPIFIRLRERRQFFHGSDGRRTWAYDFTRTQGAVTKELARIAPTVHEIELELIDPTYLKDMDARRIARSMLHRFTDLVGSTGVRSN